MSTAVGAVRLNDDRRLIEFRIDLDRKYLARIPSDDGGVGIDGGETDPSLSLVNILDPFLINIRSTRYCSS